MEGEKKRNTTLRVMVDEGENEAQKAIEGIFSCGYFTTSPQVRLEVIQVLLYLHEATSNRIALLRMLPHHESSVVDD